MNSERALDATDARILLALAADPRATVVALAERLGLSRNTVQARVAKMEQGGALGSFERRITPRALGHPLIAFVTAQVNQHRLAEGSEALAGIAEGGGGFGARGGAGPRGRVVGAGARGACPGG